MTLLLKEPYMDGTSVVIPVSYTHLDVYKRQHPMLRLTGHVSTANRGRLIQARAKLCQPLPDTAQGLILEVQGNAQSYYVHIRTKLTDLSRQLYQAKFCLLYTSRCVKETGADPARHGV